MRWAENGGGVLPVTREVAQRVYDLSHRAKRERDPQAARDLADLAEGYGCDRVGDHPVTWWRDLARLLDEVAEQRAAGPVLPVWHPDPTTQEDPMGDAPGSTHHGTAPSTLRIEHRGGAVRFRITTMGQPDAVCDIPDSDVGEVVAGIEGVTDTPPPR